MQRPAKRIALLGLCTAVAMVLAYAELLLPPLFTAVPGIKLGLPNIAIIFVLYRVGAKDAALVSLVRMTAISMLFGTPVTFLYSLAGGVLSLGAMILLKQTSLFSTVGVSVVGGVLHNVGQILMAMLLLGTAELGYYLIVLAITGTVSGILVGIASGLAVKRIPLRLF